MKTVIVAGGGLAGLAAAAALGSAGYSVDLFESRPFLGGRATSYPVPGSPGEIIDNCQHVLLRCCHNLIDLYRRLAVERDIKFYREFYFVEPGGRVSVLKAGALPPPLHFSGAFLAMDCFSLGEKVALARALLALNREGGKRTDLDRITMLDWLREKRQPERAIDRFWKQVLVSAVNEDLGRMAAAHGFQVYQRGFMATRDGYEMGVPAVPLEQLYRSDAWAALPNVRIHTRSPVERLSEHGATVGGALHQAGHYICALPFERVPQIAPELQTPALEHSPITGVHLWFDRPITHLPHATLLDRTMQWMFNKRDGRHVQLVVSASRSLVEMSRGDVIDLAIRELEEFFPGAEDATLESAHVVQEIRATFSAQPGIVRPPAETAFANIFLAGDYTCTGWPATMEGAVRSGYLAAEAVTRAAGENHTFLLGEVG